MMNNIEKVELTKRAKDKLNEELDHLVNVERPAVLEQVKEARAMGDLSENADYDAARNKQGEIEERIKEIRAILNNAVITKGLKNADKVGVGTCVEYENLSTHKKYKYNIVVSMESNPLAGNISNQSPLGEAILGKKIGDEVLVKNVAKEYRVKIINIEMSK